LTTTGDGTSIPAVSTPPPPRPLLLGEALRRCLDGLGPLGTARIALRDAPGRVLAADVTALHDLPGYDYSAMDGYAVRAADLAPAALPATLPVAFVAAAGATSLPSLPPGACARIFTGAPIPDGADAVVMQEDVTLHPEGCRFEKPVRPGQHLRRRGEDLRAGQVALAAGTRVTPWMLPLLASSERPTVTVARAPRMAVVLTGDELRPPGSAPRPGSVVDSIGPALEALGAQAGATVRVLEPARDDLDALRATVRDALAGSDLVVTVGGVSVGDRDHVKAALEAEGVALSFWRVAIKPGKPLCVGEAPGTRRVLGLPGNPSSALLTFALFGMPTLRALQGDARPQSPWDVCTLRGPLRRKGGRMEFLRARLHRDSDGSLSAEVLANQSSGAATAFAWGDALVVLDAALDDIPEGTRLPCIRLESL
jgi:molybdopterin molybdotransferase